jgi:hypothetical protein
VFTIKESEANMVDPNETPPKGSGEYNTLIHGAKTSLEKYT